ncbi:hypothetical protein BCU68_08465 [Vibrio sp. 10N.286.49.B3]|uniref:OmpA family protein n=1 Tax=Vibrio sp. 10N.286.49.B3 TaxID=1880855 RepID=UPI000C85E415|nr:OmpA family protein [Vibrio sp. 10N.286.49.B3]PMH37123.1 hypothetical protein BCU68_08465 [Vibrio sp. 10N.286.49.B3]
MKKLAVLISAALVSGGLISTSVLAETYMGGKIGYGWLEDSCSIGSDCDDDAFGLGLYLGYNFGDYIGLEASYDFLGEYRINNGSYFSEQNLTALSLGPRVIFPVSDDVSIFGKVGAAYMDFGDENDTVFTGGVGLEYAVNDSSAVRFEYQRFQNMSDDIASGLDANFITVGYTYKFGQAAYVAPIVAAVIPEPEPQPVQPMVVTKASTAKVSSETFANNSAELTAADVADLQSTVDTLKAYPQSTAVIVGHTDASGSDAYNQKLSEKRAQAVASYLQSQGIDADRLAVSGKGETQPIADNSTKAGREKNRRVEVTIPSFEYQETAN